MVRFDREPAVKNPRPLAMAGQVIGLLGGSFNPAHDGHVHVSHVAMHRLGLDRVWWLVSPQNPLKPVTGMAPLSDRVKMARKIARDPSIVVTDIEASLGTRYTVDTVTALKRLYPGVTFVWLMGSDNLAGFHHWRHWQKLARLVAIAVVARPNAGFALVSPFARRFGFARGRPLDQPPAWRYLLSRLHPASSTALRAAGLWRPEGKRR
jgi:nicotinate-nucleotide adenylyltransferase